MAERVGAKWPAAQATVNFIGGHDPLTPLDTGLCANQLDVINLNYKFVGIYSLIGRNIGTCQSERKPNTNRTLQNTRKNKLKHKWFDSECILRKRELRKAERMYFKKLTDDDSRSL